MFSTLPPIANLSSMRDNSFLNYPPPPLSMWDKNHNHVHSSSRSEYSRRTSGNAGNKYKPFDDYFGLSDMLTNLTVSEPIPTGLGLSSSKMASFSSPLVTDDFRTNGIDTEMDDLDRYIYQLRSDEGSPRGSPPTVASSISPCSASPPSTTSTLSPISGSLDQAFWEFCRERERKLQLAQLQQLALQNHVLGSVSSAPTSPPSTRAARSRHGSGTGQTVCVFCRNNGEPVHQYTGHCLKDSAGRVTCPILRAYKCPYCRASGDNAHTKTYCPLAIQLAGDSGAIQVTRVLKTDRTSLGKKKKPQRPLMGGAHHACV